MDDTEYLRHEFAKFTLLYPVQCKELATYVETQLDKERALARVVMVLYGIEIKRKELYIKNLNIL